jgi:osmoprotectant transport system ATP-binding protein
LGAPAPTGGDPWRLVVDEALRPLGWAHLPDLDGALVDRGDLYLGGTLAERQGSLRTLLDSALSSPSGRGVVVSDGVLAGTVRAEEVLQAIQRSGRSSR